MNRSKLHSLVWSGLVLVILPAAAGLAFGAEMVWRGWW